MKRQGPQQTVMLVGGAPEVCWLFGREVRQLGHELLQVTDPARARETLQRQDAALVMAEDHPGREDTLDLVRWIKAEHPDCEVFLFASAPPDFQRTFDAGTLQVTCYLVKPFRDNEPLVTLIDRAVERYQQRAAASPR